MSHVIEFLEQMGRDAHLRYATSIAVEQALERAGVEPVVRAAILGEDRLLLESLLGAKPTLCAMVVAPAKEDEEEKENDDELPGEGEDGDDEKKEE